MKTSFLISLAIIAACLIVSVVMIGFDLATLYALPWWEIALIGVPLFSITWSRLPSNS